MSEQWVSENERLCNGSQFVIEKFPASSGSQTQGSVVQN